MRTIVKKRGRIIHRFGRPRMKIPIIPEISRFPYPMSAQEYSELRSFFAELLIYRSDTWPASKYWPKLAGGPSYQVEVLKNSIGRKYLLIRFSKSICRQEKPAASVFYVGENNSNQLLKF